MSKSKTELKNKSNSDSKTELKNKSNSDSKTELKNKSNNKNQSMRLVKPSMKKIIGKAVLIGLLAFAVIAGVGTGIAFMVYKGHVSLEDEYYISDRVDYFSNYNAESDGTDDADDNAENYGTDDADDNAESDSLNLVYNMTGCLDPDFYRTDDFAFRCYDKTADVEFAHTEPVLIVYCHWASDADEHYNGKYYIKKDDAPELYEDFVYAYNNVREGMFGVEIDCQSIYVNGRHVIPGKCDLVKLTEQKGTDCIVSGKLYEDTAKEVLSSYDYTKNVTSANTDNATTSNTANTDNTTTSNTANTDNTTTSNTDNTTAAYEEIIFDNQNGSDDYIAAAIQLPNDDADEIFASLNQKKLEECRNPHIYGAGIKEDSFITYGFLNFTYYYVDTPVMDEGSHDYVLEFALKHRIFDDYGKQLVIGYLIAFGVIFFICTIVVIISYHKKKTAYENESFRRSKTNAMAHDLKTPLTAINGYAEMLKESTNDEKKEHYTDEILETVQYMNEMVAKNLELSKLEAGMYDLKKETFDYSEASQDILESINARLEEANLTYHIEGNLVNEADPNLMRSVLTNLIDNAVKYSKKGTEIVISMDDNEWKIVNQLSAPLNTAASKLKEAYKRDDESRTGKQGNGLGLSIVDNIVAEHGYRLELESDADTFTACIDMRQKKHKGKAGNKAKKSGSKKHKKLKVIVAIVLGVALIAGGIIGYHRIEQKKTDISNLEGYWEYYNEADSSNYTVMVTAIDEDTALVVVYKGLSSYGDSWHYHCNYDKNAGTLTLAEGEVGLKFTSDSISADPDYNPESVVFTFTGKTCTWSDSESEMGKAAVFYYDHGL